MHGRKAYTNTAIDISPNENLEVEGVGMIHYLNQKTPLEK